MLLAIYLTPVVQISGRICPQMAEGGGKGKGGSYWEVLGPPGRRLPCQRAPRRQIKHLHLPNICKQCTVQFNFLLARLKRSFIQRISAGPLKLKHHWHIPGENNQGKCWIKIFRTPLSSSDFSRKIPHGNWPPWYPNKIPKRGLKSDYLLFSLKKTFLTGFCMMMICIFARYDP